MSRRLPIGLPIGVADFRIRSFSAEDRGALVRHADNPHIAKNMRDIFPSPYTAKDAESWLLQVMSLSPETEFAIADSHGLIGGIGLEFQGDVHRRTAALGYWLGARFWGRGIMTRTVEAFVRYAFSNFDLVRIYAHVFETNPASARVLEKAGFTFEGRLRRNAVKNGRILDQLLYAKVL